MSDLEQRVQRLEAFLRMDPDNVNLMVDLARSYLQAHQPEPAQALLERALALQPEAVAARFEYATLLLSRNHVPAALEIFAALLAAGHDHPAIRYNLAYCHLNQFAPEAALAALQPLDRQQLLDVPTSLLLARVYYHLGQLDQVDRLLHSVLEADPQQIEARALLAQSLLDQERYDEAEALAQEVLAVNPGSTEALVVSGYAALDRQDYGEARAVFDRLLAVQPKSGRGWVGAGLIDMQQGQLAQAEILLQKGLNYLPGHIGSWLTLAWCQVALDKFEAAQRSVEQAMSIDRNFGETHGTLAVVQNLQGRFDEAARTVKVALRLNPASFAANFAQTLLLRRQGKTAEADLRLQEILQTPVDASGRTLWHWLAQLSANAKTPPTLH